MTTASNYEREPAWESLKKKTSEIVEVTLEDVYIDQRFQRQVEERQFERIAGNYHPQGIGIPLVAVVADGDPDGSGAEYASLDGQTRFRAMWKMNAEIITGQLTDISGEVPEVLRCEVYGLGDEGPLSVDEAALLFLLRNNKTLVAKREKQRIQLAEGDPALRRAEQQVRAAGFRLFREGSEELATMPFVEAALSTMKWGDKKDRPEFLTEVLNVMGTAYGRDVGDVDPVIFQAVTSIMRDNPDLNTAYFVETILKPKTPARMLAEAFDWLPPRQNGVHRRTSVREYMKTLHNRRGAPTKLR